MVGAHISIMKYTVKTIIACFALLIAAPIVHAEDLETFLKRFGTGATKNDLHENFHGTVFANGQAFDVDRDKLLKNVEGQKAAGTQLVVDNLTIISKTETPGPDGKGSVISIVVDVSVTEKVGGSTLKIQSEDHHIVFRDSDGAFHSLYFVVTKQARKS
jgi:hypothetical protein